MLLAMVFDSLLHTCAPNIGARTMTAIVRVESGGNPLAIHDNTLDRSFSPPNLATARSWASQLLALNHSVDLGLAQINSANLGRLGLSTSSVFDPCRNVHAGASILAEDYASATATYGAGQEALGHAIGAYNSGTIFAGRSYLDRILVAAGVTQIPVRVPELLPNDATRSLRGGPTTSATVGSRRSPQPIVVDGATYARAKSPPVTVVDDVAHPVMMVIGNAAKAATSPIPVVLDGR